MAWSDIVDTQTPNWGNINTAQIVGGLAFQLDAFQNDAFQVTGLTPTWGAIDTSQIPGWATLSPAGSPSWGDIDTVQTPGWAPFSAGN